MYHVFFRYLKIPLPQDFVKVNQERNQEYVKKKLGVISDL